MELIERFLSGEIYALAKAITLAENRRPEVNELFQATYARSGQAHVIGITGPPGAGKSTLTDRLAVSFRRRGYSVAVVAVDPSSPFGGGAVLGDRIRMQRATDDTSVFVRSLATRGHVGGLAAAAADVVSLLDGFGFQIILVETVGTGQSEVEVMNLAHTTVVVSVPGLGDDIQAIKAGILEIGDLFVVNKADRDGADATFSHLQRMLELVYMGEAGINYWPADGSASPGPASLDPTGHHGRDEEIPVTANGSTFLSARHGSAQPGDVSWRPPILKVVAHEGTGVEALVSGILEHMEFLRTTDRWEARRVADAELRLRQLVSQSVVDAVFGDAAAGDDLQQLVRQVADRRVDPYKAAQSLLRQTFVPVRKTECHSAS